MTLLVTVLVSGGVLLGVGALAVDIGRIWVEREQLQSGAQTAALALAKGCALDPASCATQSAKASTYANTHAKDGKSAVSTICGTGPGMSTCPSQPDGMAGCLGTVPGGVNYVEVRTSTLESDDSTLLPPTFARSLAGYGGYQGKQVAACSRVAWGAAQQGAGLSVTISTCEWNDLTSNGTNLYARPDVATPAASADGVIYLHSTSGASNCPAGPSGWDAPGGFGWLDETGGSCLTTVSANGSYPGNTGTSASQACQTSLANARANKQVLVVPIYDGVNGTGTNTVYHLAGLSAFVLTGYAMPGFSEPSWLSGTNHCTGVSKCLYGYFTTGIVATTGPLVVGATNYGVSIINTVG